MISATATFRTTPIPTVAPTVVLRTQTPDGTPIDVVVPTPKAIPGDMDIVETLKVPWTVSGGVRTANSYSGYVSLTITGTGSAAGDNLNDAFYLADEVHAGCESTCYFI